MDLPEPLRFIKRFLIQANQVERSKHPLIAYYLRLYAVTLALKLPKEQRNTSIMQYIGYVMDELEKLKGQLDVLDKDTDRIRVEEFAAQLFDHADKNDRAGKSTKLTALGFSAASVVFESLEYFGALEPEIVERIRYAKWKAAEISKAVKNGQTPTPGPYIHGDSMGDFGNQLPPSYNESEQKSAESFFPDNRSSSMSTSEQSDQPSISNSQSVQPTSSIATAVSSSRLSLDEEKRYYALITDAEKKSIAGFSESALQRLEWSRIVAIISLGSSSCAKKLKTVNYSILQEFDVLNQ